MRKTARSFNSTIRKSGRPKKTNPARRRKEWKRAYESPARVRFIAAIPCIRCGDSPSENAHIENGGMGRKADADKIVPLCRECHSQYHAWGRVNFEHIHHLDLDYLANEIQKRWASLGSSQGGET